MSASDQTSRPATSLLFILHAHQPYVLGYEHWPLGTDRLCQATAASYLPLLNIFNRLANDGCSPRVTIGLSPLLCEMLADLAFADLFEEYLQQKIEASNENARRFARQGEETLRDVALFWEHWHTQIARDFEQLYNRDLLDEFRRLQNEGHLEIIPSTASHACLATLGSKEAAWAQIQIAVENYKKHFGRAPRGMYLPTAVTDHPGHDALFRASGIEYLVSSAGLNTKLPRLGDGAFATKIGEFQNDARNLDFHKRHYPGDLRLWSVTAPECGPAQKQPYDPLRVIEMHQSQAASFLKALTAQQNCAIFPAELIGYEWFEGANWLQRVLRNGGEDKNLELQTCGQAIHRAASKTPQTQQAAPPDLPRAWMARDIHSCENRMTQLAREYSSTRNPKLREIIEQCGREVLLMESSDWLAGGQNNELRCAEHISAFQKLAAIAAKVGGGEFMTEGERVYLAIVQERDRPFGEISMKSWA